MNEIFTWVYNSIRNIEEKESKIKDFRGLSEIVLAISSRMEKESYESTIYRGLNFRLEFWCPK